MKKSIMKAARKVFMAISSDLNIQGGLVTII